MKISLLLLALTLTLSRAFSQDTRFWLATTLENADTVWLIRHTDIRGHKLLLDGRLNPTLLDTQKILAHPMLDSLVMILTTWYKFDHVDWPLCFDPHHAIVWTKGGKLSYIDLCFHCLMYVASDDLTQLQGTNFGARKWAALESFFTQQGLH